MHRLQIVSLDIPYPADYGGAIDIFYKIKSLAQLGVEITLHCFKYRDRTEQEHLKKYCKEVYYYHRKTGVKGISLNLPYIVYSRRNKELLNRLSSTNDPILFEGLHSCYYLNHHRLKKNFKIVRCHNIEHEYYQLLAKGNSFLKQVYFKQESNRLEKYEAILNNADTLITISENDQHYFSKNYPTILSKKISAFHSNEQVDIKKGAGNYLLFHGSLHIHENEKSALYIIDKIATQTDEKIIITGRNPSDKLTKACKDLEQIKLIANPSVKELDALINNAHIHLMYASQSSGLKLKLLKSLYNGRHVIGNNDMITENDLKSMVHIANSPNEWIDKIKQLTNIPFAQENIQERKNLLSDYSNLKNARELINLIP